MILVRFLAGCGKYVSLLIAAVVCIGPLVVVLFASLKTSEEYARTGPLVPPQDWVNLSNYATAFSQGQMVRGFINTAIILGLSLLGAIFAGTLAAYALDRFAFRGRRLVYNAFLVASLIPAVLMQVATFHIISGLGLFNTRGAAILLFMGTDVIAIYIFLQFMASIPVSLDEAAMLEGASRWTIYWRIILPLLRPAIATAVIIKGIAIYNEFYIPFLYMPSGDLGVISTSLYRFKGPFGGQWEIISAGIVLVIVPTLVLFLFLQRFIYRGLVAGAVK
ncbi:MAG: carbohydrate ABC transporter permease [Micrococcales bacterium]|nr:carbohydrate ABC transporter permease [Micrococcales bacterium]